MYATVIVKVVGSDCNLRCRYCYYVGSGRNNTGVVMGLDLIERMLRVFAGSSSSGVVRIVWHGGEPLLPGISYYREVVALESRVALETDVRFDNRIQTNGTLVTSAWADFFRDNHFKVGVSLDGPQDIHDCYRISDAGVGSLRQTMRGVSILQDAGVKFGCLAVLTNASVGRHRDVFSFFIDNGISRFRVKPCYEVDPATGSVLPHSIRSKDYGDFLIGLFDAWIEYNDPRVDCGPLNAFLRGLLGNRAHLCTFTGQCGRYLSLWPNGDLYQCEFSSHKEALVGNILCLTGRELADGYAELPFVSKMRSVSAVCLSCRWYSLCKGACFRYRLVADGGVNVYCESRKRVFAHIASYLGTV